jgi:uncharacterized protein YbbC (DUF1343 family)
MKFFLFLVLACVFPVIGHSQDSSANHHETRVVVDRIEDRIEFFIKDELMAVLDVNGLTVNGSITSNVFVHNSQNIEHDQKEGEK